MIAPVQKSTKEDTWRALVDDYKLHEKVYTLLVASPLETLEDMRFFWLREEDVKLFVDTMPSENADSKRLQGSRLTRAWCNYRQWATTRDAGKSHQSTAELDDLLEEVTLAGVQNQFWARHHMTYPSDMMPSDQLVSRCYRELERRLLTVYNIWTVKDRLHQVTTTRKRERVAAGANLWFFEEERESLPQKTAGKYLSLLHTYLLSLSIAGGGKRTDRDGMPPETRGSDPADYIQVPWTTLEQYYHRAVRVSQLVPEGTRCQWLEKADVDERATWVQEFRESGLPLGKVVQDNFHKRAALWQVPVIQMQYISSEGGKANLPPKGQGKGTPGGKEQKKKHKLHLKNGLKTKGKPSGTGEGKKVGKGQYSDTMRDGTKLCWFFNHKTCNTGKGKTCSKGAHKCGLALQSGRVCGGSHAFSECCSKE